MATLFTKRIKRHLARSRGHALVVEGLEDRFLLYAANGTAWVFPQRITYSFIPDGTSVGGIPSALFRTMNAAAPTATWQSQIQKAAAVWEVVANIQLVQVTDNSSAIGTTGTQQGDDRFGDIRIGAIPQAGNVLALAFLAPPINGGTVAGDVLFNSSIKWQVNAGFDVGTVAIHELGHALGMDHSQVLQADMYAYYNGIKQSLNADDVSGIQSVYGPIQTDAKSDGTLSTATDISAGIDSNAQLALGGLLISNATDQDWFKVVVPASAAGTMTVTMQASNLSSLMPRVTVFNGSGQGLAQAVTTDYGGKAMLTIANVSPGQVYYIRAIAGTTGAGSVGAYGLLVNFGTKAQTPVAGLTTVVLSQADQPLAVRSSADTIEDSDKKQKAEKKIKEGKHWHDAKKDKDGPDGDGLDIGDLSGWIDELTVRKSGLRKHQLPARHATLRYFRIPHPIFTFTLAGRTDRPRQSPARRGL